ncbi:DNA ligase [compost metagenome]
MDNRIEALRAEISRLNHLYYNEGESDVEDDVYTSLKAELRELEGETDDPLSPLNQVGAVSNGGFEKVKHLTPMLSLGNVYNEEELTDWVTALGYSAHAQLEKKLDGLAIDLLYDKSKLKYAATRGDGDIGDDITDNAIHFEGIPEQLENFKGKVEIRGEAIIPHDHFHRACQMRVAQGKKIYANPRNMVAGLARKKEGEGLQGMGIRFIAYDAVLHTDAGPLSIPMSYLAPEVQDKFYISEPVWKGLTGQLDKIVEAINDITKRRKELGYDIDGLVLKLIHPAERATLGQRSTSPRWAVAYKFEAQTATTVLESVEVQVGRTGVLTPVAKIRPVSLCGVTISSVTLHNFEEIERLDLRIGDTVVVSRRGDVIPKIESVILALRVDDHGLIHTPVECPCCGAKVTKRGEGDDEGVKLFCTNLINCPAQLINRMAYFVSRDGIDVKNLGPAAVESLIAVGSLGSFSSLFYLGEQDFYAAGIGEAMTDKIIAGLNRCKKLPFYKALRAVGIPDVGDSTARALAARFPSFRELGKASFKTLQEVDDVGPAVATSIMLTYVANDADLHALDTVFTYTDVVIPKAEVQDLAGKTVVVSGSDFDGLTRRAMEDDVISRGGKLTKSVSKNTDILFAGVGAGPDKVRKAKELRFIEDGIKFTNPNSLTTIMSTDNGLTSTATGDTNEQ